MERFDEFSETAERIMIVFELFIAHTSRRFNVSFKWPPHNLARRFLNEIIEFEPLEEEKRSSLKPWEEG